MFNSFRPDLWEGQPVKNSYERHREPMKLIRQEGESDEPCSIHSKNDKTPQREAIIGKGSHYLLHVSMGSLKK